MSKTFQSVSPINDTVVWSGTETTLEQVDAVMQRAAEASVGWRHATLKERIDVVQQYAQYVKFNQQTITDLIIREVGKLPWDADAEVSAAIAKSDLSIRAFRERRNDAVVADGSPRRVIRYQPIGVALVLGPFNFPLHLPGGQIIPALLAGNAVVMKPSDQATAVGQWIADAWMRCGLPENVFQMIVGGVAPAVQAIDSPYVGGVFLTGSRAAGRAIHRQLAGRYDVLLALELGGNNPMVVIGDAPAVEIASTVTFSAFISAGQRCTCARRAILVDGPESDHQLQAIRELTNSLQVGLPGDDPAPQVGPLISTAAATALKDSYDRLLQIGCTPIIPFKADHRRDNLVHPAIVDGSALGEEQIRSLGEMEWFGPLLVVQRVQDFETALSLAKNTAYGLSASLLGGDRGLFDRFLRGVSAGVVNWNRPTTGAAGMLPFGGLGDSGNHRPAGFYAVDFCNDPVASLEADSLPTTDPWCLAK
jgi:succinylglutamic semialdehyde dehydrogenase